MKHFLEAIPSEYKSLNLRISTLAKIPKDLGLSINKITRRQLIMNEPYEILQSRFSPAFQQQLNKAEENQLQPASNLKPEKVVDFYKAHNANYHKATYYAYMRIMYNAMHRGWGFANGITNGQGNLLAVAFFIYSHGKIMLLLPAVSKEGKAKGAMELILMMLLRTHANKPVVLDFNGFDDCAIGGQELVSYQISR